MSPRATSQKSDGYSNTQHPSTHRICWLHLHVAACADSVGTISSVDAAIATPPARVQTFENFILRRSSSSLSKLTNSWASSVDL